MRKSRLRIYQLRSARTTFNCRVSIPSPFTSRLKGSKGLGVYLPEYVTFFAWQCLMKISDTNHIKI
ncbi:MAG: hypothetical protein ACAI35_00010 [Candidatus Methylacidiphilales bacterium]